MVFSSWAILVSLLLQQAGVSADPVLNRLPPMDCSRGRYSAEASHVGAAIWPCKPSLSALQREWSQPRLRVGRDFFLLSPTAPVPKLDRLAHLVLGSFVEFVTRDQAIEARARLASHVIRDRPMRADVMKDIDCVRAASSLLFKPRREEEQRTFDSVFWQDLASLRSRTLFIDKLPKVTFSVDLLRQ